MEQRPYGLRVILEVGVEEAETRTRAALAVEGFGVLTEIDVQATLKEKIGVDRPAYKILGACNPVLANRALGAEEEIGLLLPCNVVVYESESGTIVEALDPGIMNSVTDAPEMEIIAAEAREKLARAMEMLEA
ncbi:MAG TPA: DUF302 domain-containing protein [Acidimicrobiia bacterium]|nr:DUF302 domain-containing protein [Acidimicrobiia bacterium]